MTTHYLAIPVVGLAVSSLLFSTHAQSLIDSPDIGSAGVVSTKMSAEIVSAGVSAPVVSANLPALRPEVVSPQIPAAARPQNSAISDEEMARLYLIRKQYREAQDLFYRLTQQQPNNAVYWNELGISFHNQSELNAALKCYEKSVKLDHHYADAQNNAGTIWFERKKYARAIRAYKRALKLRQDFAPFYLNLGFAYFGEKEYADSIAAFRKALQLDPESMDPNHSRAGTVIQDRSITAERGQFYFLLAKSFAEAGNLERCVIYLRKARDEGYKDMQSVKTDPSFASILQLPEVQDAIAVHAADTVVP
jgi:tetratricopeptide (TPR) repeat protein